MGDDENHAVTMTNLIATKEPINANIQAHIAMITGNPHVVTKTNIGLSNVTNVDTSTTTNITEGTKLFYTEARVNANTNVAANTTHRGLTNDPHNVTKDQVGLGSVENQANASQAEAEAGVVDDKVMTPLKVSQAITAQGGGGLDKETLPMPVGEPKQWTKKSEMNVLPNLDGWTLSSNTGTVSAIDGIFNMTTITAQAQKYEIEAGNVDAAKVKRVQWRPRVNLSNGTALAPGQALGMADGVKIVEITMAENNLYLALGGNPTIIDTSDYTIYRKIEFIFDNVNGVEIFVDGVSVHTSAYASLPAVGSSFIIFGDFSGSVENFSSNVDYDYINYQLDLGANPDLTTGWVVDGGLVSKTVTTVNTYGVEDSSVFSPKPTNASGLTWVNDKLRLNVDRIDDNTIKLWALDSNTDVFDFELDIIKG
jgi:hypothetical protein